MIRSVWDLLTLNAPYPFCQKNLPVKYLFSFIHLEELDLIFLTTSESEWTGLRLMRRCKWSSTPPIFKRTPFSFFKIPLIYLNNSLVNLCLMHRSRLFVLKYDMVQQIRVSVSHFYVCMMVCRPYGTHFLYCPVYQRLTPLATICHPSGIFPWIATFFQGNICLVNSR